MQIFSSGDNFACNVRPYCGVFVCMRASLCVCVCVCVGGGGGGGRCRGVCVCVVERIKTILVSFLIC